LDFDVRSDFEKIRYGYLDVLHIAIIEVPLFIAVFAFQVIVDVLEKWDNSDSFSQR